MSALFQRRRTNDADCLACCCCCIKPKSKNDEEKWSHIHKRVRRNWFLIKINYLQIKQWTHRLRLSEYWSDALPTRRYSLKCPVGWPHSILYYMILYVLRGVYSFILFRIYRIHHLPKCNRIIDVFLYICIAYICMMYVYVSVWWWSTIVHYDEWPNYRKLKRRSGKQFYSNWSCFIQTL